MPYELIRTNSRPVSGACLVLDTSGSMARIDVPGGTLRRIDLLARILSDVLTRVTPAHLITFNSIIEEIPLGTSIELAEPVGGTDLAGALYHVAPLQGDPLLLITDGTPNSEDDAFRAMRALQRRGARVVVCYYCGPDGGRDALRFLRDLAAMGAPGSSAGRFNLAEPEAITDQVIRLLTHG